VFAKIKMNLIFLSNFSLEEFYNKAHYLITKIKAEAKKIDLKKKIYIYI